MKTPATGREQAEQRLADLEAEVARVRASIDEHEAIALEGRAATEREADRREDLLARDADTAAVEQARLASAAAAGRCNEAGARARGLRRLLDELEEQLPAAAVAVLETVVAGLDEATATARARLDAGGVTGEHVAVFCDAFREGYAARQALFETTRSLQHVPGTFDLRPVLEHLNLIELAPDHVRFRNVAKPPLREEWRPALAAHLEAFKTRRESAARAANAAAHARRDAEARAARGAA